MANSFSEPLIPPYRINSATSADAGNYHVEVSNFKGSATSNSTHVTVTPGTAPRFTSQPSSIVRRVGETANFNFSGSSPITFALLRNGNIVVETDWSGLRKLSH